MREFKENPSAEALTWLLEMEMLTNPTVLNSVVLNIFKLTKGITDAQFVVDTNDKKLLVYLELDFWHRNFKKQKVADEVLDMLDQSIPSFKKRVVFDKQILNRALFIINEKRKQELRADKNETVRKTSETTSGVDKVING